MILERVVSLSGPWSNEWSLAKWINFKSSFCAQWELHLLCSVLSLKFLLVRPSVQSEILLSMVSERMSVFKVRFVFFLFLLNSLFSIKHHHHLRTFVQHTVKLVFFGSRGRHYREDRPKQHNRELRSEK